MRISDWSSDVCSSDLQHASKTGPQPCCTLRDQGHIAGNCPVGRIIIQAHHVHTGFHIAFAAFHAPVLHIAAGTGNPCSVSRSRLGPRFQVRPFPEKRGKPPQEEKSPCVTRVRNLFLPSPFTPRTFKPRPINRTRKRTRRNSSPKSTTCIPSLAL